MTPKSNEGEKENRQAEGREFLKQGGLHADR